MAHRDGLSDTQTAVLKWVGSGSPPDAYNDTSHRIVAAALRRRGLVTTSGHGPNWHATLTNAGRSYLEHITARTAQPPRQGNVSVTQELIDTLVTAGGSKSFPRPGSRGAGIDYEHRAGLAVRYGKVPAGHRLVVRRLSWTEVEIALVEAPPDYPDGPRSVAVLDRVSRFHPVVTAFRSATERHEVSRTQLGRASRILHALAVEAERRGYDITSSPNRVGHGAPGRWSGKNDGHVRIAIDSHHSHVRISEEGLGSRSYWEQNRVGHHPSLSGRYVHRGETARSYNADATGRLCLELVDYNPSSRPHRWADRRSWTVEDKLGELLFEIEVRSVEAREQREEAERKQAERERQWRVAMHEARARHAEVRRSDALGAQVEAWDLARRIHVYCDALSAMHPDDRETLEWVTWARSHAETIDPTRTTQRTPLVAEPGPEELRPFLNGWDPYGPSGH